MGAVLATLIQEAQPGDKTGLLPEFDTVFVFLAFIAGLFPLLLKSFTGIFFIMLPILYCAVRMERVWPVLTRNWALLLLPGFALASTAWSAVPATTAYYATQFLLTVVVALMIGSGTERCAMLTGMFAAFFLQGLVTFVLGIDKGGLIFFGGTADTPFIGFAGSKNTTADMASLGVLTAVAMLAQAFSSRRIVPACLSILLIAIDTLIVASARSAGANAAASVAILALLAWTASRVLPVAARTTIFIGSLMIAAAAAATRNIWYEPIFQQFLAVSGKESDLTGRSYIWSRAELFVQQNPMLGRGYAGFWRVGDLEAEAIWEKMYVANRTGFNFHNSVYEILVHLGYVGLALFSVVFLFAALTLFLKVMRVPTHLGALFCALIVYDGLRFQFESLPMGIFAHNTLFLYAAFGFAFRPGIGR